MSSSLLYHPKQFNILFKPRSQDINSQIFTTKAHLIMEWRPSFLRVLIPSQTDGETCRIRGIDLSVSSLPLFKPPVWISDLRVAERVASVSGETRSPVASMRRAEELGRTSIVICHHAEASLDWVWFPLWLLLCIFIGCLETSYTRGGYTKCKLKLYRSVYYVVSERLGMWYTSTCIVLPHAPGQYPWLSINQKSCIIALRKLCNHPHLRTWHLTGQIKLCKLRAKTTAIHSPKHLARGAQLDEV